MAWDGGRDALCEPRRGGKGIRIAGDHYRPPNPQTLAINGTQQFTAVGKDAGGNVIAITPTWSVVTSGGAIDSTGLFTAGTVLGTFPNTVRASSGSVSGTATVTVTDRRHAGR